MNPNDSVVTPVTSPDRDRVDPHRSLSPPNTAEKFFLPLLPSSEISALALAESIRNNTNGTSTPTVTSKSANTLASEYVTCEEGNDDSEDENSLSTYEDDQDEEHRVVPELYGGPIQEVDEDSEEDDTELIEVVKEQPRQPSPPRSQPSTEEEDSDEEGMARRGKQTKRQQHQNSNNNQHHNNTNAVPATTETQHTVPSAIAPPPTTTTTRSAMSTNPTEEHFDVSQHAYEQVKNIWAFGKGLPVVKTFLGATEVVASKVLSVKGVELTDVDREIKPQLSGLDNMLNPAIGKVVQIVMPFVQKAQNAVKPVVQQFIVPRFLKPLGIVKDQSASNGDKLKVVVEGKDESSSNGGVPQGKKVINTTQVVTPTSNIVQ